MALGRRIVVIGTTGSGKTTLARRLAGCLDVPLVELDALHWDAGWTPAEPALFRRRVSDALQGGTWVVDGNYGSVRDLVWEQATGLIWLDYPLPIILWRLVRRTCRRIVCREDLWNGNREGWRAAFSRDSLLLWAVRSHRRWRRDNPRLFARPQHAHLAVVRLCSSAVTQRWLSGFAAGNASGAEIRDAAGREYARVPATPEARFVVGGALGTQIAEVLDGEGKPLDSRPPVC